MGKWTFLEARCGQGGWFQRIEAQHWMDVVMRTPLVCRVIPTCTQGGVAG